MGAAIHATMNISLDGCCDHTQVIADDEFHERISDLFERFDALLLGRKTYDLLHGYWPGLAESKHGTPGMVRLAQILNDKPKHVVSRTNPGGDWQAKRIDPTREAIAAVREQANGDVLLVASPTLARTVVAWHMVEEYHIAVSPMVAGRGPHFLDGLDAQVTPSLIDLDRLASGVLLLRYDLRYATNAA